MASAPEVQIAETNPYAAAAAAQVAAPDGIFDPREAAVSAACESSRHLDSTCIVDKTRTLWRTPF